MKSAPIPANESARLKALASYKLLDTSPEAVYDEITKISAEISGTPTAFLSLLDENREWFKSKQNIEAVEEPRDVSFCAHAILEPEIMIVPDARYDERFHDNPLTTGGPRIVFYAGVPIINEEGFPLGVLAVTDSRKRDLSEQKLVFLKALAKLVATHFELRKLKMQLGGGNHSEQETYQVLKAMLHEIDKLFSNNPRLDQIESIQTAHNLALSLIMKSARGVAA